MEMSSDTSEPSDELLGLSEETTDPVNVKEPIEILLVEDDPDYGDEVKALIESEFADAHGVRVEWVQDWVEASKAACRMTFDLAVLDVWEGKPEDQQAQKGLDVMRTILENGFVPVVINTGSIANLEVKETHLIRVTEKARMEGEDQQVIARIREFIEFNIPQSIRAARLEVHKGIRKYFVEFLEKNWQHLPTGEAPKLMPTLLLNWLGSVYRHRSELLQGAASEDGLQVHAYEYYVMPEVSPHASLGDIRKRASGDGVVQWLVALWPSCDFIPRKVGKEAEKRMKAERILVACARVEDWSMLGKVDGDKQQRNEAEAKLKRITHNGEPRYHFLPAAWNVPNLVIDFQSVQSMDATEFIDMDRIATLASPYSESLIQRFTNYVGRIGTPDWRGVTPFQKQVWSGLVTPATAVDPARPSKSE